VSSELSISSPRIKAWASAATLFVIMAGHTVLETARDSLFLQRLPIGQLPFTYLAIAVAALFAADINGRLRKRLDSRRALALTLLIAAAGNFGFSRLFKMRMELAPHALYVWVAVGATLVTGLFWLMLSELFTVADAKRHYATISAGGVLGAMVGGAVARFSAVAWGDSSLLYVGGGLFMVAAGLTLAACVPLETAAVPEPIAAPMSKEVRGPALRDLRSERYLRRILWLTLISTVVATLVDYNFKAEVARTLAPSTLGRFFGTFNAVLNGIALIAQFALAPQLLTNLGVGRSLLVLPGLLAVASATGLFVPGLASAVAVRGTDGSLRYSLQRTAAEVLYLPLPAQARARWKMIVDSLGQRGGQALASAVILSLTALALPSWVMAIGICLLSIGWLVLGSTMERQYLALFRARIKDGAVETRADVPELDLHALESLITALGSTSDDEVLASIDLLAEYDKARVIPSLLLYHPSRAIVLRALEVLMASDRRDFAGPARRLLERDDDEIRAAAMVALAHQLPKDALKRELTQPIPIAARAAVLVAVVEQDLDQDGSCAREIEQGCAPEAPLETRLAFARAFRIRRDARAVPQLLQLARRAPPELALETACAMRESPDPSYIPALLAMLPVGRARNTARDALVAIGPEALEALRKASSDLTLARRIRTHFPRSISRFDSSAATELLLERLDLESDGWVRFKIIRGLGLLRRHIQPRLHSRRLHEHARRTLRRAVHFMAFRIATERDQAHADWAKTKGAQLLLTALQDKEEHAVDRAVRLIGLLHKADVIHNIRQALAGTSARLRAESLELLVHRVPTDVAQALVALLDHTLDASRQLTLAANALDYPIPSWSYEERLALLLEDDSEVVRTVTAYHVGELRLHTLHDPFAKAAARTSGLSFEVFARVGRLLGQDAESELTPELVPVGRIS
jgi:AAA family ATP:ADP antiporter